ncbi:MAG: Macrolide export ATP-binding/permease protein MacB [Candidatus Izimaplasma bacterium HR2]|nr:MAG: Macrolide export ATP-binding/permease protein MacB [Candidatus Izimaplasma bacterium HR2]
MIKLNKLEKYYNRNKSNEIHVIDNINLTLPEKGLVVLLGPSGSGKTTLLNVLGGLDKVHSGMIQFDNTQINRYKSRVWDEIRNKHVGYVFQNYNLLNSMTVYDNIAITLNMVGVVDKKEIDKRIDYILENIGMANYRKRRASQLSGGQQQRVAIARALAKNPKVIIADEPTGNLDSKNTIDIMNIIKNISKTKLVVLVTHEKEIADFYADRVITLSDGQIISDIQNTSNGELDVQHDTDIYLKDLNKLSTLEDINNNLTVYSDEDIESKFDVKLIIKNKTIYLDISNDNYKKVQLLDKDSEIKVFNRHFEKVNKTSFEDSEFNLEAISSEDLTVSNKSVVTVKESVSIAWKRITGLSRLGKLFYLGFIGGAMLVAIAIGLLANVYYFNPDSFLSASDDTVIIKFEEQTYDELLALEGVGSIGYVSLITDSTKFTLDMPKLYQAWRTESSYSGYGVRSEYVSSGEIIKGRNVEAYDEIVFDKVLVDKMLKSGDFKNIGITTYDALMSVDIILTFKNNGDTYEYIIDIVGISDTASPVFYAKEETIFMLQTGIPVYEVFEDLITLSEGTVPSDVNETLTIDDPLNEIPIALRGFKMLTKDFTVSGLYTATEEVPTVLVPFELLKEFYFNTNYTVKGTDIFLHSTNVDSSLVYLGGEDITAISLFDEEEADYKVQRLFDSLGITIFTLVTLAASALSFYFIIRSSLISRIYEVSVYRALGVAKKDILKMFITEIILITTITSLVGYIAMTYLLMNLQGVVEDFVEVFHISFFSITGGILLIYVINIISGLLPVSNLLRKTPAEILSKYDF